jgi:hypothetical protein
MPDNINSFLPCAISRSPGSALHKSVSGNWPHPGIWESLWSGAFVLQNTVPRDWLCRYICDAQPENLYVINNSPNLPENI